jgi:hypothetical protein
MSTLLSRIMLAIFLLPTASILYTLVLISCEEEMRRGIWPYSNRTAWLVAALATWIYVGVYWILLWRRAVNWTRSRKRWTLLAAGGAAIVGGIIGILMGRYDDDLSFFAFSSVTPLVWLPLTVLIWRETVEERAARFTGFGTALVCPTCGYNLKGLTSTRCPECGTLFTLDDLLDRQRGHDQSVLERQD